MSKRSKRLKRVGLGFLVLLVVIQFIRPNYDQPEVEAGKDYIAMTHPPAEVENLLRTACYDCHSHETKWPWYSQVSPISWWTAHHVEEGNGHLNFSIWGDYEPGKAAHKLEECYEEVEEGEMPMNSYTWAHSEASLTAEQRGLLVTYFKEQYHAAEGHSEGHEEHHDDHGHDH